VTIHRLDKGEDTGPIAAQAHFQIPIGQSLEKSMTLSQEVAASLLQEVLIQLKEGKLELSPQEPTSGTVRAKNPAMEDIHNLSNWSEWSSSRAYHFLNGVVNQYPELISGMKRKQLFHYRVTGFSLRATGEKFKQSKDLGLICRDGCVYYVANKSSRQGLSNLFRIMWR
jgi:methionyl-tRNA formyltransferase